MTGTDLGVTSVQFLLASALGLFLFVGLINLVVVQYGRGALQSAVEQGVRAGSLTGDPGDCESRINSVVSQLLAGRMSDDLVVACSSTDGLMSASALATFASWTPLTGDFRVELTSRALIEQP